MINVSIEATGKCEHCPHMVLEMNTENTFADSKVIARHIEVRCKNEHLCNHLKDYLMDDQKRYYIGVMIPLNSFKTELNNIIKLNEQYDIATSILYDERKRLIATKHVVIMYFSNRCSESDVKNRHFDAVFNFDQKHIKSVRPGTEIREDSYYDYILKKEGCI